MALRNPQRRKVVKPSKKQRLGQERQAILRAEKETRRSALKEAWKSEKLSSVELPLFLTVRELSERLRVPVTEVISILLKNSILAHVNQEIDHETAAIVAQELGVEVRTDTAAGETSEVNTAEISEGKVAESKDWVKRPPVVTVMGHVDHGKTTLLDTIRKTEVAKGEHGGITQHIGAYQVHLKFKKHERTITLIDTPGHEAFTAMRAHGAQITDIVILVVAADDGVKPQTKEAVLHARSAGVPIVVAINKIDAPGADPSRVKTQLASECELVVEALGGETPVVEVSAAKGTHIQELLETVLLIADLKDLKAPIDLPAAGVVIESHLERGLGPLATVLVQQGVLKQGDLVVVGESWGKVRRLENDRLESVTEAYPGTPVRISGLKGVARAGTAFVWVKDESEVGGLIREFAKRSKTQFTFADASKLIREGTLETLRLVVKADTAGSLQAIHQVLSRLSTALVGIKILHEGIGPVSESEVLLARTSQALVVGFHVPVSLAVKKLAQTEGVEVATFTIIYELESRITEVITGLQKPKDEHTVLGQAKILRQFPSKKDRRILGARVESGELKVGCLLRFDGVGLGPVESLRIGKEERKTVKTGEECGIGLKTNEAIPDGALLECVTVREP